ncbi:TetR/AcrR family transcriptional regulator [Aeromicrobium sp. CF4.19]|uniref:TetR/AcrR family transcriptional regulator n=1 Tax=Aeromicrobium sp. CF4.19 TaxID=3373082 RepID=UPI003EE48DEC
MTDAPRRRPRKDALANRQRILDHAERVLNAEGLDVSLHRIAEELSMGIGTVYRHFPTHDDLLLSLYHRFQERIVAAGEDLLELDDAYERVVRFIDVSVDFSVESPIARAVGARMKRVFPEELRVSPAAAVVMEAVTQAQAEGKIRDDVDATDIAVLAGMLADLVWLQEPERTVLLPRMRALALDSIAPSGAALHPLPSHAISAEQLTQVAHRRRRPS